MKVYTYLLFVGIFVFQTTVATAQVKTSVLAEGEWYKIGFTQSGIHKIDADFLRKMGVQIANINPQHIRIYGNGGGMLPQANAASRHEDLMENAIFIAGEADGKFDNTDYILLYAQSPHEIYLNETDNRFEHQTNLYSDTSYYFLTVAQSAGLRISKQGSIAGATHAISTFDDYAFHEKELYNAIAQGTNKQTGSGREWYGEKFNITSNQTLDFALTGIVPNSDILLTSSVMAYAPGSTEFTVKVNEQNAGSQPVSGVPFGQYDPKGSNRVDRFTVNAGNISAATNLRITITYDKRGLANATGYLNYIGVQAKRQLQLYGTQMAFRSLESRNYSAVQYVVSTNNQPITIWDITNPIQPKEQEVSVQGAAASFSSESGLLKEFIAFTGTTFNPPVSYQKVANQNLHALTPPDLLIITHPLFAEQAQQLADFRRTHDGLQVSVVNTVQVFNEFASGRQDITALRDFIRFLYQQGHSLRYVLLFGDASYDYKNRLPNNTNFVPVYESRQSLHPIFSYSSDDYYGFMGEDEGEWEENNLSDGQMDLAVGRLPVKSQTEAKAVVDKLIHYAQSARTLGKWRNYLTFVADDGDANQHQLDADKLAEQVTTAHPAYNIRKIYMDAYPQLSTPNGQTAPAVHKAIDESIDKGSFIINYTGHGGEEGWAEEQILTTAQINSWKNKDHLPLFVTATCEFGRYDDPLRVSGAELLLLNVNGGGIGLITTTRPVFSNSNFALNQAFYQAVFTPQDGKMPRLGDVMKHTKNNSLTGSINRNFALLGDPSMRLAYPQDEIVLTRINEQATDLGLDTLRALQKIRMEGLVQDAVTKSVQAGFNGTLYVTVFDKASQISTFGTEKSPPMTFNVRQNTLFEGKVRVHNGQFSLNFIVPKDIDYRPGTGKVSLYAIHADENRDAGGAEISIVIGGSASNPVADITPPKIRLFMDDTTFVNGGTTSSDPTLLALLYDESGITIARSGIGHEITAILSSSPETQLVLNEYFTTELDSYQHGRIQYPLRNFADGQYQLRVKAWDTYNNSSEAKLDFIVSSSAGLALSHILNYPNPFSEKTNFQFDHNRAGEDLDIQIHIFNASGQQVKIISRVIPASSGFIRDVEWDGRGESGEKLSPGVYIYKVVVRSLADNQANFHASRLVIIR